MSMDRLSPMFARVSNSFSSHVDVVLVCGCGAQVAVPRSPSNRQVFGGCIAVARVSVVFVLHYTPAGDCGGLHPPLLSRRIVFLGCAKSEATAHAMVSALYTC